MMVVSSSGRRSLRACLLSLSPIADDPRVRRQGDALRESGWQVDAVGLPALHASSPSWPISTVSPPAVERTLRNRVWYTGRFAAVRLFPRLAPWIYWRMPYATAMHAAARDIAADLYIANDWPTLPLAARLAADHGSAYAYDSHELASEERSDSLKWRLIHQAYVSVLEGRYIADAAVLSTVSDGIAGHLATKYRLRSTPLVIRNTPPYVAVAPRRTGPRIRVLYHGIIAPGRGLDAAIDSVPFWRPEFDLTIRGPGAPEYLSALNDRIAALGLTSRVSLAPPVPMTELVREAAVFDVGFFALPAHSRHNAFALPNKVFEYAMAGLALCVSELPEMAQLVRKYGLGTTFSTLEPKDLARAINRLDRITIDRFRAAALAAAKELCWEQEAKRMIAAYRRAVASAPAACQMPGRIAPGIGP
jgi:glycosyltransferase involved in cell wall biosynthesis